MHAKVQMQCVEKKRTECRQCATYSFSPDRHLSWSPPLASVIIIVSVLALQEPRCLDESHSMRDLGGDSACKCGRRCLMPDTMSRGKVTV